MDYELSRCDAAVVGSGAAGLMAAIKASDADCSVFVLEKAIVGKSGSTLGAEQIAAVGPWSVPGDSPDAHFMDSIVGGRYINHQMLTRIMVERAAARIADLEQWGMRFDRGPDGRYVLTELGGHSYPRQLSYKGDRTGLGVMSTLRRRLRGTTTRLLQDLLTIDLVVDQDRVVGVAGIDLARGSPFIVAASAVVLATGGAGQLYSVTSNSGTATGDGFAMALRAGVPLADMEQLQFYPIGLVWPDSLKGVGIGILPSAKLVNGHGERFMSRYDPELMESAARDVLSRAIWSELAAGRASPHGGVFLDLTQLADDEKALFADASRIMRVRGLDILSQPIEVAPTAHFVMGGIAIDGRCRTRLEGLYAAGEVAAGAHGANRLGNNALTEALVFGAIAGHEAAVYASEHRQPKVGGQVFERAARDIQEPLQRKADKISAIEIRKRIQQIAQSDLGVTRREAGLTAAAEELRDLRENALPHVSFAQGGFIFNMNFVQYHEARNMLLLGEAIARAAGTRKESRGAHYIVEYPSQDDRHWLVNTLVEMRAGALETSVRPAYLLELRP